MSKSSTDPGLKMILAIEELDQDTPQTYEIDEDEFYKPETFIRGLDPEFIARSGLAIGGEYSLLVPPQHENEEADWKHVRITGIFFDGYAFIDLSKGPGCEE